MQCICLSSEVILNVPTVLKPSDIMYHVYQLFGILTKPLIRFLLPASSNGAISEPSSPKSLHSPLLTSMLGSDMEPALPIVRPSSLRMLITKPTHTIHYYWRKFDDALMRPMFGGRGFVPFSPGSPTDPNVQVE